MKKMWNTLGDSRPFFALTLAVGIAFFGICVIIPNVSGDLINAVTTAFSTATKIILLYLGLCLLRIVFSLLSNYMEEALKIRLKRQLRDQAFEAFSRRDSSGREDTASFVSFVNNDIPSLAEYYFLGEIDILKCVFMLLFSAASLFSIHWALALIIIVISVLIVAIPGAVRKKGAQAREAYSHKLAQYNTLLRSFLDGLGILKTYRYGPRANAILSGAGQAVAQSEFGRLKWQMGVYGINSFLQVLRSALILCVGVILIHLGQITVGSLVAVIQLAEMIASPIELLSYLRHSRSEVTPLMERYEEMVCAAPPDRAEPWDGPVDCLCLEHVSCQAGGVRILRDVSVKLQAGKKYMISGVSGSGKSTLLRLIARVGDLPYGGEILAGRRDIRSIAMAPYYQKICPVFQEPYLFYATLEENILLGREIEPALYRSIIARLNLGYLLERYRDQEISPEIMEQLSGGERQRIALARAMAGRPEVYLLDEITSALDPVNALQIEAALLQEHAMIVHICHKPNPELLEQYNARFVLREGRLYPAPEDS